jgi:hypothetical protein
MTTNDVNNRGNVLSDKAISQLKDLPRVIDRQIKYLLSRQGSDPVHSDRLVRIAQTVSQDFAYPLGSVNKYEVKLGKPDFDNTTVGLEIPSFTPTRPDTTDDKVRIACTPIPRAIPEGTLVFIELHNHKWYILPEGVASLDIVAFDTGGYCNVSNDPQYFIVTIDRIGNDEGPSQEPHDAADFPSEYKMIYHGFSHDRMTGGNAYNTHTWIYRVCDDSFDLNVYVDTNAMLNWVDSLPENVGDPNDSWELNTDAPNICGFNIIDESDLTIGRLKDIYDICLAQNNLYDQFDLVPIPLDWDDCNLNLCSERNPAWNVVGREIEVKVTERPCGVSKVTGEDENGMITVRDTLGSFLYGRSPSEIVCRRGVAVYMNTPGEYECHWLIIWMDMFNEIQVVSDIIIGTRGIEIERKLIDVWRECDLEDEYIEGNTCEES